MHVGIDVSSVDRFINWNKYSDSSLKKVFTNSEVTEYRKMSCAARASQFLASRFSVKEATFKALSSCCDVSNFVMPSFLKLCKQVSVSKTVAGVPQLCFDPENTIFFYKKIEATVSISHERCHAAAIVLLKI